MPVWGEQHRQRIADNDIENYRLSRVEKVTASTVNRELALISDMFRKAVEWRYLKEVTMAQLEKIKTGVRRFRYLAHEEMEKLLDACQQSPNPQLHVLVVTAMNTGMRLGEITASEWNDVDFKLGMISVDNKEGHRTKNYEPRTIPMNDQLTEALAKHPRRLDSPYVFARKTGENFRQDAHVIRERGETRGGSSREVS